MPQKTILCVDDERDVVDCLHDTFIDDYTVKTALSGTEALEVFDHHDIALVITDQRMPGMEGTELLARIKTKDPLCKKILLTGYADINAAIDSFNKGAIDRYFNKPWDDDELQEAVTHLLKIYDMDSLMNRAISERKKLTDTIKTQKQEITAFASFLDCQRMGICVLNKNLTIHHINKQGLKLLTCQNPNIIIGAPYQQVLPFSPDQENVFRKAGPNASKVELKLNLGQEARLGVTATMVGSRGEDSNYIPRGIIFEEAGLEAPSNPRTNG